MANISLKITQDPFIPLNSLILLTEINGLIVSHIANQLLSAGYRVRGTVRSKSRCTWVEPFFASRHGANRLELIEVPNFTIPRIWKAHVACVSAVISGVGTASFADRDVSKPSMKISKFCTAYSTPPGRRRAQTPSRRSSTPALRGRRTSPRPWSPLG